MQKTVNISYQTLVISALPQSDQALVATAREAALKAYAPYSKFQVGAAVLLQNGTVVQGNNQENAAYPSGLCAERVALFAANALWPQEKVMAIAVVAYTGSRFLSVEIPPCGACRQVILESEMRFASPIKIVLAAQEYALVLPSAKSLLPFQFDASCLGQ